MEDTPKPTSLELVTTTVGELARLDRAAQQSVDDARPTNTARAYALETACFGAWCRRHGVQPMPVDARTLRAYLRDLADHGRWLEDLPKRARERPQNLPRGPLSYGSIVRALSAICKAHTRSGHPSPWTDPVVEEIRDTLARELGTRQTPKDALDVELFKRVIDAIPTETLAGMRDAAMLLCGWHGGGRRRSEIVAARVEHFSRGKGGLHWLIPRSKTDQHGQGLEVPLAEVNDVRYCPVRAFERWCRAAQIHEGPVFRAIDKGGNVAADALNGQEIARRVKRYASAAGLDPKSFSGHSVRRGFITSASEDGSSLPEIMAVSGHKTTGMVMRYVQTSKLIEDSPARGLLDDGQVPRYLRRLIWPVAVEFDVDLFELVGREQALSMFDWIVDGGVEMQAVAPKLFLAPGWKTQLAAHDAIRIHRSKLEALAWMFVEQQLGAAIGAPMQNLLDVHCGSLSPARQKLVADAVSCGRCVLVLPHCMGGKLVNASDESHLIAAEDAHGSVQEQRQSIQLGFLFVPKVSL